MNKLFFILFLLLIISLVNNYFLTMDNFHFLISSMNLKKYSNIVLGTTLKDYVELLINEIYYFFFFVNFNDLNSFFEVIY